MPDPPTRIRFRQSCSLQSNSLKSRNNCRWTSLVACRQQDLQFRHPISKMWIIGPPFSNPTQISSTSPSPLTVVNHLSRTSSNSKVSRFVAKTFRINLKHPRVHLCRLRLIRIIFLELKIWFNQSSRCLLNFPKSKLWTNYLNLKSSNQVHKIIN